MLPTITHIHIVGAARCSPATARLPRGQAHKTIYDGCVFARGLGATVHRFRADDLDQLDELLRAAPAGGPRMVCMDGVNSMTGNVPDLPALAAVCREHGALLYVDDAHGFGVIGERAADETSPVRRGAATRSSGTSARPTTTSCWSAASPRRTRRCWRSWPCRPG